MVFRLNPLATPFTPMGAKLVGCSVRPMLVRQMAVPNRKISWAPSLVTEERVFDFEKGAEARQCPQGNPRLCKIKREDGGVVKTPLEETLMWEKLFTAQLELESGVEERQKAEAAASLAWTRTAEKRQQLEAAKVELSRIKAMKASAQTATRGKSPVVEDREEKEKEEWKEQRMKSWLDSAKTALPPDDRFRMMEELDRDIEEMCESLRKINLNYCE
jgi:hypothetical protein